MGKVNKSKKKRMVILIIVLVVIIVGVIGGCLIYKYLDEDKSVGSDWGDTYYKVLDSAAKAIQGESGYSSIIDSGADDATIQFIEIDEEEIPYMIVSYELDETNDVLVYHLEDEKDASTTKAIKYNNASVEYLYNILLEKDMWYVHIDDSITDEYISIVSAMKVVDDSEESETEDGETYNFAKDSITSVETEDGETLSISELEETFMEIEYDESSKIEIDFDNMSSKEIKRVVTEAVSEYKTTDEIMTEEIKTLIEEELEKTKALLAQIQEIVEAREAESDSSSNSTADVSTTEESSSNSSDTSSIIGTWEAVSTQSASVSLGDLFGTYLRYQNMLQFNEDGTYKMYIGAILCQTGKYQISGNKIYFTDTTVDTTDFPDAQEITDASISGNQIIIAVEDYDGTMVNIVLEK